MRISGGSARGITLMTPKGDATRPATDGMRQAVFSSIASRVPGTWFLDLFAGSGAYGLEAVSRGAAGGYFVEKNARAAACVQKNIAAVCKSAAHDARTLSLAQADVLAWNLPVGANVPDLVFIDPPYEIIGDVAPKLFAKLTELLAAKDDPVIVFEMPGELTLEPEGWTCVRRLGKGAQQPTVAFFRKAALVAAAADAITDGE
jgi:16S rRNA (guanine966-N2)-methyltransferase